MRLLVCILAGLFAAGAAVAASFCVWPATAALGFWALVILVGLAVERWRYKPFSTRPPGPGWEKTGERFVDPETGKLVTVWFRPASGERRYVAG